MFEKDVSFLTWDVSDHVLQGILSVIQDISKIVVQKIWINYATQIFAFSFLLRIFIKSFASSCGSAFHADFSLFK